MNHLAHFLLSGDNPDILIGNFIADFIKKKEEQNYRPEIKIGIALHRFIDHFTDNHMMVKQSIRRFYPVVHKYAPVVNDIAYDYFLSKNWHLYEASPLSEYIQSVYDILIENSHILPEPLSYRMDRMIEDNWLSQYGKPEGIRLALNRMERKIKFPMELSPAVDLIMENESHFNEEFKSFFPELQQNSINWLIKNGL